MTSNKISYIPGLTDKEYEFVYKRVPRLCIDLIIILDGGVLLSKREIEPFRGFWHFPGGRILYKESIGQAIKRIAKSEIGSDVLIENLIGIMEITNDGKFIHSVSLVFKAKMKSSSPKLLGSFQARKFKVFKDFSGHINPYHKRFLIDNSSKLSKILTIK